MMYRHEFAKRVQKRWLSPGVCLGLAASALAMPPLEPPIEPSSEPDKNAQDIPTALASPGANPVVPDAPPGESLEGPEADGQGGMWASLLDGWVRRVELGASGTDGNTQSGSLRSTLRATKKEGLNEVAIDATYQFATSDSRTTQDRFNAVGRYDRLMAESRWRYFASGSYEADRFRDWDHRWTSGGGFGFQTIVEDDTSVLARGGMSLAQDVGGFNDDIRTEAILGMDLSHQIDERQKITGTIDFLPNVSDFDEFRVNARAGWEFLIDPESNLSLRIGGEERYDATAVGRSKRNDLSYYMVLAVEF